MSAITRIRNHVDRIGLGDLFSTRKFLSYGSRGAVDQALYMLVKSGEIVRVARGIFMKKGSAYPDAVAVAKVKAGAFGKQIFKHGADAANAFGFPMQGNETPTFACTGRSSSFRFGNVVIRLIGTSPRKLHGQDSLAGQIVRALWQLGNKQCTEQLISKTYPAWRKASQELETAAPMLPAWMNNLFYWGRVSSRASKNVGNLPPLSVDLAALLPEFAELFNSLNQAM